MFGKELKFCEVGPSTSEVQATFFWSLVRKQSLVGPCVYSYSEKNTLKTSKMGPQTCTWAHRFKTSLKSWTKFNLKAATSSQPWAPLKSNKWTTSKLFSKYFAQSSKPNTALICGTRPFLTLSLHKKTWKARQLLFIDNMYIFIDTLAILRNLTLFNLQVWRCSIPGYKL